MKLTAEQINALKHNLNWNRAFVPHYRATSAELEAHQAALVSALETILADEVRENAAQHNTKAIHEYLDAVVPAINPGHVVNRVRILIDRYAELQKKYQDRKDALTAMQYAAEPPMIEVTTPNGTNIRLSNAQFVTLRNGGFELTHVYDGTAGLVIHWKNKTGCHIALRYDVEISQRELIDRVIEGTRRP